MVTSGSGQIIYTYKDEQGALIFEKIRTETLHGGIKEKAFKLRRPIGLGSYIDNLEGVRRVLYRLPEIIAQMAKGEPIIIAEGEKDVDTLAERGFTTTSNFDGAGKWLATYNETLRGADILICGDNDIAGKKHVQLLCDNLIGIARQVRIVSLPEVYNGKTIKDVTEFFEAGGTDEEFNGLLASAGLGKKSPGKELVVEDLCDFLAYPQPDRPYILDGMFRERSLIQISAKRGMGKTFIALGLAVAIATGKEFLGYAVPRARRVLYIEPEMDGRELQDRLKQILEGAALPERGNLRLITYASNADGLVNLAEEEEHAKLEAALVDIDVIILDGKSFLCRVNEENRADDYAPFQEWAKRQRRAGKTVIITAHQGKAGNGVRGSSAQEDLLDLCVELTRPDGYKEEQGLRVRWSFTKARGLPPACQRSFIVQLSTDDGGRANFTKEEDVPASTWDLKVGEVIELSKQGLKQDDIAERLGFSQSKVSRMLTAEKEKGKI